MKKLLHVVASIAAALIISCSGGTPQDQLKEIQSLQAKNYPMAADETESMNSFIDEGKQLLEEGKVKESTESLKKGLALLKQAEDAYIFNKAD